MSALDRPLSGSILRFALAEEQGRVDDAALLERRAAMSGLSSRKAAPRDSRDGTGGGSIVTHRADGSITVRVLDGDVRFRAAAQEHRLAAGDVLAVTAGVERAVASDAGGRSC